MKIPSILMRQPWFRARWNAHCEKKLLHEYRTRREHYQRLAVERGIVFNESSVIAAIQKRLSDRGYSPVKRRSGEVHTYAFVPELQWHRHLLPDLQELGELTRFDYIAHGYTVQQFETAPPRRREMNERFLASVRETHKKRPIDWVFVYAQGREISAATIQAISSELGIPTVNMCLDDKQSWTGQWMGDHPAGQIGIASSFDISWTSARVACEWYLCEGARPLYMPEGFDMSTYKPLEIKQDIPVSFIGDAYGFRPMLINFLEKNGIKVACFGNGWGTKPVWAAEQAGIINRSVINLGSGGIVFTEKLTNLKTRDFEITGTGGGVYLTTFNPELTLCFDVGKEILCYRDREEMLELIRYHLAHPDEGREIAKRARMRCVFEHRWLHRYTKILRVLGVLQ